MSGASPLVPRLQAIRTLLAAARRIGGPHCAVLELCILTLCLPWEAVAIELDRIDWRRGITTVPARGGHDRVLALPPDALKAITRIAGSAAGSGQVVTGGRGVRLPATAVRLDRLADELADGAPETICLALWNFHGIRVAGRAELVRIGSDQADVDAVLGRQGQARGRTSAAQRVAIIDRASFGIERWCRILLSEPAPGRAPPGGGGTGRD